MSQRSPSKPSRITSLPRASSSAAVSSAAVSYTRRAGGRDSVALTPEPLQREGRAVCERWRDPRLTFGFAAAAVG